jgi:hypothetical protein
MLTLVVYAGRNHTLLFFTTFEVLDLLSIDLKASFISFACRAFLEVGPFEVGLIRVRYVVRETRVNSRAAPLSRTGTVGSSENEERDKAIW